MLKLLFSLLLVHQLFAFQDLLSLDCKGTITMGAWFGKLKFDASALNAAVDWINEEAYQRAKNCYCSTMTKNEFLSNFAVYSWDFWLNALTGRTATTTCVSPGPDFLNKTGINILLEPLADHCTISDYQNSIPCTMKMEVLPQVTVQFAIKKCPNSILPYISLSCAGDGCQKFGSPCNSDSECTPGYCFDVVNVTQNDLIQALQNMKVLSNPSDCFTATTFFDDIINFVRKTFFQITTNYDWGTPSAFRLCSPYAEVADFSNIVSHFDTYTDNVTGTLHLQTDLITSWDGTLPDGTSATSDTRLSPTIPTWETVPSIPPDNSIKPVTPIIYHSCTNYVSGLPQHNGVATFTFGTLISALRLTPPPAPNPPYMYMYQPEPLQSTNSIIAAVFGAGAGSVASLNFLGPFNLFTNQFFNTLEKLQKCRDSTLSNDAFRARFGFPFDWEMKNFVQYNLPNLNFGKRMADWDLNMTTKIVLPSTCSYENWLTNGICTLKWVGLQSMFPLFDVTIRVKIKKCQGYDIPEILVDCEGTVCGLLSTVKQCSVDADCGAGLKCFDLDTNWPSDGSLELLDQVISLDFWKNRTCPVNRQTLLGSLYKYFRTVSGLTVNTDPFKFCYPNLDQVVNLTQWSLDQATVNRDVITLNTLLSWNPKPQNPLPSGPTSSPSTNPVSPTNPTASPTNPTSSPTNPTAPPTKSRNFIVIFTITNLITTNVDSIKEKILTALKDIGIDVSKIQIVIIIKQKRVSSAEVTITSTSEETSKGVSNQLKDSSSTLNTQIGNTVGKVDTSSVLERTADTGNDASGLMAGFIACLCVAFWVFFKEF